MKIYLMRHGHALDNVNDSLRELSPEGISQVEATLSKCLAKLQDVEEIYHSELVRAKQSAMIVANQLAITPQLMKGLKPNDSFENFAELARLSKKTVLYVGHMPFMGDLVAYFCHSPSSFSTSEIICLEIDEKKAKILWRSGHL